MEVGTQTLSSFDPNSNSNSNSKPPPSFSFRPFSSDSRGCDPSEVDFFDSPATGDGKCESPAAKSESNAAAAMKVQKFYRGYRTRRRLADSAVVAEEFWWQAIDYARLSHSTVSFFDYTKPETVGSRWHRITLNASKVGKGLSKDAKAQTLAFQHWIEAIDPRHRYGHSLHVYYEEWCKADAGQPFFYWLDIGDGKEVDLEKCPRSKLRQECIKYLGPQERELYEYIVKEGKIVHKQTGALLDTKKGEKWIFVLSTSKRLYAGVKEKGEFHHSSFLAGGTTLAAGRLVVEDGTLKSISAYSGHYRPTDDRLDTFLSILKENGVKLDEVQASEDYENYDDNKSSFHQLHKASEDYENYDDNKSNKGETTTILSTNSDIPKEEEKEPAEVPQTETKNAYQRTLSGGLQSPKAEVPKTAILERINSKKAAKSYQLGHQVSLKWSTGVGPRIGCIADYPMELRLQALEFTNLSPRTSPTFPAIRRIGSLASPTACPSPDIDNGDLVSSVV